MQSYNHPGTTELEKCSWAGTQTISSLDLVRKIDLNVLNTWLAKQELPVRRSGPVRKIDTPDYEATTKELKKKLSPLEFSSLEAFHKRKLRPEEALSMFLQDLKQMLLHAMQNIDGTSRNQLLLHQFLAGL